ncbi:TniQ family protein [Caballeronia sp. KNU42]
MLNVPTLLPDQTIESAGATAWAMNGWARWRDAMQHVFGSSNVRPERMFHGGIAMCFRVLAKDDFQTPEAFIERHGFVSITKPFMDVTNYDYALWKMGRSARGIGGGRGNAHWPKLVDSRRHYCRACVDKEIQERGFAYTHRSHQIIGAFVCHVHGERLAPLDAAGSDDLAAHGFLAHSAFGSDTTWRLGAPVSHGPVSIPHHRLAQFIKAALDGELPRISYEIRHSIIAHKSKIYAAKSQSGRAQLDALQRRVDESFSAAFLKEIGAEFLNELHRHVSHITLEHPQFLKNPLANLAMLSVLFETPKEFLNEIRAMLKERRWSFGNSTQ